MASRSSWKGYLKLSLVSVPVKAYTATNSTTAIHLNQLHATCHRRIRYKKVCPEHGEVTTSEIVSGYEYAKDQYAVIDTDELEKLRSERDKSITVDQFIDEDQLDSRYQTGTCYFLLPDGPVGQQAYALIRDVMVESRLQAVAQVVISNKEQLVLLRPIENLIGMFVLRYAADVKHPSAFSDELVDTHPSAQELKLTKMLMDGLREKEFDMAKYTDKYTERLSELIQSKVEGKELVTPEAPREPRVINLMEALKASLERVKPEAAAKQTATKPSSRRAVAAKPSPAKQTLSAPPTSRTSSARSRKGATRAGDTKKQRKSG